jgi:carbonic anhydrase
MLSGMFDDLLEANRLYATDFSLAGIPARAAKEFALVTCMDSRIEPLAMLGLGPGDAKIVRNAGGRVTPDTLRSLVLAAHYLGVRRIAIMQHTDCAMTNRTDASIRADLIASGGVEAADWEFLAMPDPDVSLHYDVDAVRTCALIPANIAVEGWRYDVETGQIRQIVPAAPPD